MKSMIAPRWCRARSRAAAGALLAAIASTLTGCAGVTINGKVIEGSVSFIGAVDQSDERLKGPGVADVPIKVKSKPETGVGSIVAEGASKENGDFSLPLDDRKALKSPIGISARKEGYLGADGVMTLPGPERTILVVLKKAPTR